MKTCRLPVGPLTLKKVSKSAARMKMDVQRGFSQGRRGAICIEQNSKHEMMHHVEIVPPLLTDLAKREGNKLMSLTRVIRLLGLRHCAKFGGYSSPAAIILHRQSLKFEALEE
jgi:hypothetical protein